MFKHIDDMPSSVWLLNLYLALHRWLCDCGSHRRGREGEGWDQLHTLQGQHSASSETAAVVSNTHQGIQIHTTGTPNCYPCILLALIMVTWIVPFCRPEGFTVETLTEERRGGEQREEEGTGEEEGSGHGSESDDDESDLFVNKIGRAACRERV